MKKILWFSVLLLLLCGTAFGQAKRSVIRFRLSDGSLIRIALNGRYFNKTGRYLTVGDIPGKRQKVKIYRFRPYANKPGGKASLVFQGKIKIEKGGRYEAVVDTKTGQLYLTKVNNLSNQPGRLPPPDANQNLNITASGLSTFQRQNGNAFVATTGKTRIDSTLSPQMEQLGKEMNAAVTDEKKLKAAMDYLKKTPAITTANARQICSWLLFDDNRLKFLKNAYPKVTDRQHLGSLADTFTENTAQKEWQNYLAQQR